MVANLVDTLGIFLYPQLAVSVAVIGLCLAYMLAAMRGEFRNLEKPPWRRQLEPLGRVSSQ